MSLMRLQVFFVVLLVSACGAPEAVPTVGSEPATETAAEAQAEPAHYQYVGTYRRYGTPISATNGFLQLDGRKLKLSSLDRTRYVGMDMNGPVPEMREHGTYGVNGRFSNSKFGSGEVFLVEEIAYLGGGDEPFDPRERLSLADFFVVDPDATGPLTLDELQIQFPGSLDPYFNAEDRECFTREVVRLSQMMGAPEAKDAMKIAVVTTRRQSWESMTPGERRLQMARYVTSMALGAC